MDIAEIQFQAHFLSGAGTAKRVLHRGPFGGVPETGERKAPQIVPNGKPEIFEKSRRGGGDATVVLDQTFGHGIALQLGAVPSDGGGAKNLRIARGIRVHGITISDICPDTLE